MKKILAIVLAVVMLLPVFAVNVFAADKPASADETVVFESAEGFSDFDPKEPNAFFGKGSVWGRKDSDIFTLSMDEIKAIISEGGSTFSFVYTGSPAGWCNGGVPVVYFHAFDFPATCKVANTEDGKKVATLDLDEALKAWEANGKTVDDITDFTVQHGQNDFTLYSAKFTRSGGNVAFELDCGDGIVKDGWKTFISRDQIDTLVNALKKPGAKLVIESESEGWAQVHIQGSPNWSGLYSTDLNDGVTEISAATILEAIEKVNSEYSFKDIWQVCTNAEGGKPVTIKSFKVVAPDEGKKTYDGSLAFIYVTEEYHAVLIGGRFLAMPHTDVGGYCPMCHSVIASEPVDQSVFVLETTGGQDYQDAPGTFADGVVLADVTEGKGNARIATSWVDGGKVWNDIVKAVPTEGAWLKITYTGTLNSIAFQTEKTSAEEAFETTTAKLVEEGEKKVAWFNCADIVANSPVALSGDFGGWANFMLNFEGDTTVYGFEVLVPAEAPVAE